MKHVIQNSPNRSESLKNSGRFFLTRVNIFFSLLDIFSGQDQMTIQRLKDRITQLDIENSLLTKASSIETDENDESDFDTLLKRISKLKVLIRVANDRFGQSMTIEGSSFEI